MRSNFKFVGELLIPRETQKFCKKWNGGEKENVPMCRISFGIKENDHNTAFVELFGMKRSEIITRDSNNDPLTVAWNERTNEDIISNVAFYRKHVIDLGGDEGKQEFITEYDAVEYLSKKLPEHKGKLLITGTWEKNPYKGKFSDRFVIGNVYAVNDETNSKLQLTMDYYYNADSIDMNDLAAEGKIYVTGYAAQYMSDSKKEEFIPQPAILCKAKYDMDNEKHKKLWEYKKSYLENLSAKKMYHIAWECRLINGTEEVDFDESMLTQKQKEQVELGIRELSDFKPKGGIYGDKISEVRLFDPVLTKDFADGIIECDFDLEEFEDRIFSFSKTEKLDDVLAESKVNEEDDDENLF